MGQKFLKEILLEKKRGLGRITASRMDIAASAEAGFLSRISPGRVNIIAEIKRASPSRGVINKDLDVAETARVYDVFSDFISGLSVLTEELYFNGKAEDIGKAKQNAGLPVLRKDFIFNKKQVYESAALGASCILLIKPLLGFNKLIDLYNRAREAGLDVLVEVHTRQEFLQVLDTDVRLIGINNRDLRKMEVDSSHIISVLKDLPETKLRDRIIICESGVESTDYIEMLFKMGINVFLIGSHFMASSSLENTILSFRDSLRGKGLI